MLISMSELLSCSIIEKDLNNDILWTWTYPSITEKQKSLSLRKCPFETTPSFVYGRYFQNWFYICAVEVQESTTLPSVKQFANVLWAKDFNPEKYEKLCQMINKTYLESGNPTHVLQLYLSVITKGVCTAKENGTVLIREFGAMVLQKTMVKELIKSFGLESILIYTVLLLKKRLVIYHHSLSALLKCIPSFLAFMKHRNSSETLFPWLELNAEDLEQLKMGTAYVAGFCDNSVLSRSDLFDVLVNLPAREIAIAPHARDSIAMTKIHKDIALFMVQLSESDLDEEQVVSAIAKRTEELLTQLRSIGKIMEDSKCLVSIETIKEKNVSPAMENFLFQLALAENMLLL